MASFFQLLFSYNAHCLQCGCAIPSVETALCLDTDANVEDSADEDHDCPWTGARDGVSAMLA